MTVDDALLLAFHAGALEPGPQRRVEQTLAARPQLAARLAELAARLIEPPPSDPYRIPPPGLGFAGFGLQGTAGAVMGSGDILQPGDRFRVTLPPPADPESTRLVVLYRTRSWQVVFPTRPEEDVTVAALPTNPDGAHLLDLAARPDRGSQRWAVALPPTSMTVDWSASPNTRWRVLREAIRLGQVPLASVEVHVE